MWNPADVPGFQHNICPHMELSFRLIKEAESVVTADSMRQRDTIYQHDCASQCVMTAGSTLHNGYDLYLTIKIITVVHLHLHYESWRNEE